MVFQFIFRHILFGNNAPFDGGMHRRGRLFKQFAVSASFRHPFELIHVPRRQFSAGRHQFATLFINRTRHFFLIKIAADDVGIINFAGIFILQLYQAAFATAAAYPFPGFRRITPTNFRLRYHSLPPLLRQAVFRRQIAETGKLPVPKQFNGAG